MGPLRTPLHRLLQKGALLSVHLSAASDGVYLTLWETLLSLASHAFFPAFHNLICTCAICSHFCEFLLNHLLSIPKFFKGHLMTPFSLMLSKQPYLLHGCTYHLDAGNLEICFWHQTSLITELTKYMSNLSTNCRYHGSTTH